MKRIICLALLLSLSQAQAHADVVWVGGVSDDIFDEANWDLSGSTVTVINPNVSIDDDVIIMNAAAPVVIPDISAQVRFQLGDGRTLTVDNSVLLAANNDGVGGAPGNSNGPSIQLVNGAELDVFFIVHQLNLNVGPGCLAILRGGAAPINAASVNITAGALLGFPDETPQDYLNEHLNKTTVDWFPAVVDVNMEVLSDGASGCGVIAISSVTSYCFGEQGACPCGNDNDGSNGTAGCANGTSLGGASLSALGSTSIAAGDLALSVQGVTPTQPCLFFQGNNAVNGGSGVTFGDGLRCAGGGVIRLQVRFADAAGLAQTSIDVAAVGGCAVGDMKRYQGWYRDPNMSLCGSEFNLSSGVEFVWTP